MSFMKEQPAYGETVLHCGHLGRNQTLERPAHWFRYEEAVEFTRLDNSWDKTKWFVACEACFIKHGENAVDHACGDGRWGGRTPTIMVLEEA